MRVDPQLDGRYAMVDGAGFINGREMRPMVLTQVRVGDRSVVMLRRHSDAVSVRCPFSLDVHLLISRSSSPHTEIQHRPRLR